MADKTHIDPAGQFWKVTNSWGSWGLFARAFHWIHALVIFFLIGLGLYSTEVLTATDFDTLMARAAVIYTHKAWGFVAFCLVVLRLVWRFLSPTPDLPTDMSSLERRLAHWGHIALYVLIIVMPISGWLASTASELQESIGATNTVSLETLLGISLATPIIDALGWDNGVFFEMPDPFVPGDAALEAVFSTIHGAAGWLLILLILAHVAAAMKHAVVARDGVLRRMVRGR